MKKLDDLTAAEVTELCTAAQHAWDRSDKPRAKRVRFVWRERAYVSRLTNFRMLVDTVAGEPVACRWH
jgi:hypothetical protein